MVVRRGAVQHQKVVERDVRYQPGWDSAKRREVGQGQRDCAGRYAGIVGQLHGRRNLRVLDLGAYTGYFAARLADELDARVVAVDDFPALGQLKHRRIKVINRRLNLAGLRELGRFDVALCLSVLHHVTWWPQLLTELVDRSRIAFVEPTNPREELPRAAAQSPRIDPAVRRLARGIVARTPGYDSRYQRSTYVIGDVNDAHGAARARVHRPA